MSHSVHEGAIASSHYSPPYPQTFQVHASSIIPTIPSYDLQATVPTEMSHKRTGSCSSYIHSQHSSSLSSGSSNLAKSMRFSEDDKSQTGLSSSEETASAGGDWRDNAEVRLETRSGPLGKCEFRMDFSVFFPLLGGKTGIFIVLGGVFP